MTLVGAHDAVLVALSILIATVASYTALDLAGRTKAASGWVRYAWMAAAAVAMGGGIWSMHFIAMLAFSMPGMTANYDLGLTVLSLVLPIAVTGIGFVAADRERTGYATLALSGLLMGLGIVAMHYVGMAAMRMAADLSYDSLWVALSVLIAIGASTVALWLAFRNAGLLQKLLASGVMGIAVSGMHYTAMRAAIFTAHSAVDGAHGHASISQTNLALAVATTTLLILFLGLVAAMFDRRFAVLAEKEALALRRSEEQFRALYRKTPLPLHYLDENGIILNVSEAWLDLLGYRLDEVIGRPITNFMTEESIRRRGQVIWPKLLKDRSIKDVEYRLVTKAGTVLDVLMSGRVDEVAEGRIHIMGGVVDVTERKRTEEALRQAQKIEAVGQLTGGVAHDFNNLLAVVLGNLELARKRLPEDSKVIRMVESAIQAAQRGASLTQRMLAFARRQDLKPEPVSVPDLVRGMEDLLQRSVGPQVRIETRFPLGLSRAHVDSNQLELALLNLAVNARDAMPDGGLINIAAHEQVVGTGQTPGLEPGRYLCLSITDTGTGMDEATLSRAQEPFFTTKGIGKGTGLGLSMVHGLAEQSGGTLVLRSRKGEGTTVEVWLPVSDSSVIPTPDPSERSTQTGGGETRQLTILAVDDDPLVLTNTAALLEDLGHSVIEAPSAHHALEVLRAGRSVDFVVTDQAMPCMTGVQLARAIRADWPNLPVLLATGYADLPPGTETEILRLNKPFSQEALARAITVCLRAQLDPTRVLPFRKRPS
ncbi:MAG TPA: MHYT domain-containing protein [Microvirga sp.]|jgi:PAS domain S-box-containing protein|nr:MHYT domain-containing protein [Microvirga sp.]